MTITPTDESQSTAKPPRRIRKSKGNKILEQHEMFEGEVRIFRVAQSGRVWQLYIWVREHQKPIKKSLRTKDLDVARDRAKQAYLDYLAKSEIGQPIFERNAKELVDAFIEYQARRVRQGSITPQFLNTLRTRMKHYLAFVGEKTNLPNIPQDKFEEYRLFRRRDHPSVTLMTLQNERGTIKSLYKFAGKKKFLNSNYSPEFGEWENIKKSGEKIHRDALTGREWKKIYRHLQSWHMRADNGKQKEQRRFICEFSFILTNTGIRFGEARKLQWQDVEVIEQDGKKIARINLPAHKTKTKAPRIVIGRTGSPFVRLKNLSKWTADTDYLFIDNDTGKEIVKDVYYKEWASMLKATGLDKSHKNIVYYCLRHTYATFRLYAGVDVFTLSKNMGCGIQYIQDHYGQIEVDKMRKMLIKDMERDEAGQILFQ